MIQTKHLLSTILLCSTLLCSTLSLFAIDMNETVEIIDNASKATEGLQEEFSQLTETEEPIQQEVISTTTEHNVTAQEVIVVEESVKEIATEKQHKSIPETTLPVETSESIQKSLEVVSKIPVANNISISESNISTTIETDTVLEENQTVAHDNTTEEEEGSFARGMVIFKTKLKAVCKMTGDEFAKNYTQEDWDDIYDNDEFEKVVYELCPAMKGKYNKKWTKDLYQFSLKYASDSDEIPEC